MVEKAELNPQAATAVLRGISRLKEGDSFFPNQLKPKGVTADDLGKVVRVTKCLGKGFERGEKVITFDPRDPKWGFDECVEAECGLATGCGKFKVAGGRIDDLL